MVIGTNNERRLFKKRLCYFIICNFCLFLIIVGRLVYLQVYCNKKYKVLSDRNRIVIKRDIAPRGEIVDRGGQILATNKHSYSVMFSNYFLSKEQQESIRKKLQNLALPLGKEVAKKLNESSIKINKRNHFIMLEENADFKMIAQYYVLSNFCPNITIERSLLRHYTFPQETSHVLGYISAPNVSDVDRTNNLSLKLPTAKTGKCGIEQYYDKELFGKVSIKKIEVNSRRQEVRIINEEPGTVGTTLELTISMELQKAVYKILSEQRSGSCIVMDIESGAILAFVSYPGYDINIFSKQISSKLLQDIYSDPAKPLINKALSGLYAPGSTFKVITALAGLHYGVIDSNTRFYCPGYCTLGNHKFYCWKWKYGGHGSVTVQEALQQSCDCFFYNLSRRLKPEQIAGVANDFGLGVCTGIDIPNERSGLIPTKTWKQEKKKQKWTMGDNYNMSIGQGYVLTTPLQLVRMVAIFANGLKPIIPHLNKKFPIDDELQPLKYDERHIQVILDGMYNVVNSDQGTARRAAIEIPEFEFAGKTGSSQVRRISTARRAQGRTVYEEYENKDHALFIAFAPADYPKYAVCVVIEHGGGGSAVAAPIARDVLLTTRKILER